MSLQSIYNSSQAACDAINELKPRGHSFSDITPNYQHERSLMRDLFRRCSVAFEQSNESVLLFRGSHGADESLQYIKPAASPRGSRDNWNVWNLLFDHNIKGQSIPPRSTSIMASGKREVASEYGPISIVLPVGNPYIAYCQNDFSDAYYELKVESVTRDMIRPLRIKPSIKTFIIESLNEGTSTAQVMKALRVLSHVVAKEPPEEIINRLDFSLRNLPNKAVMIQCIKNKRLIDFYIGMMMPSRVKISTQRFSELNANTLKVQGECWLNAPCFVMDDDRFFEYQKIFNNIKK